MAVLSSVLSHGRPRPPSGPPLLRQGAAERERCYGPVISAINDHFKDRDKSAISVIVPGVRACVRQQQTHPCMHAPRHGTADAVADHCAFAFKR